GRVAVVGEVLTSLEMGSVSLIRGVLQRRTSGFGGEPIEFLTRSFPFDLRVQEKADDDADDEKPQQPLADGEHLFSPGALTHLLEPALLGDVAPLSFALRLAAGLLGHHSS